MESVSIPDSVTTVGDNPFKFCRELKKIIVSPDHPALAVIDGVLFSKVDKRLVYYPLTRHNSTYEIPNGIKVIGAYAFSNCLSLKKVTIPDSVTSIEEDAFFLCIYLTGVNIPDSVTFIGSGAFHLCKGLTSVNIPYGITSIGRYTFGECQDLMSVSLSDSVTSIELGAFSKCPNLTSINLPASITFIDDGAFFDSNNVNATVERNSYAEQYCKRKGIPYTCADALDWLND